MLDEARLYGLIKETFLLLDFGDQRLLEQYDLTVPRYYALYHIHRCPGLTPGELSNYMFCDKSNASRLLRSLEQAGAVERRPHESDRRSLRIFLTPTGLTLFTTAAAAHETYIRQRLGLIPAAARSQVCAILETLNEQLQEDLHPGSER